MISYSGTATFIQMTIAWSIIRVGFGVEMEIVGTVNEVLNNFNAPLKLTISTNWDAGE